MINRFNVLILGYGEMGHAMEYLLADWHDLSIWDKFANVGAGSAKLDQAVPDADFILFCLPVNPHREIVAQIEPLLKENSICLSIAKGLDESGQTAAQIFNDVLADRHQYVLLYGPMISEEICAGRNAFAQVGSKSRHSGQLTCQLFKHSSLYTDYTADIRGISWSVVLKNVYAILFGIADELNMGDNMRGFLAVEAIRELDRIVHNMGGQAGSPYHLAGLGDLITTATSEDSHHHNLGRQLARGELSNITGEGVHTLAMVKKHRLFAEEDYPLFKLTSDIVRKPVDVDKMLQTYINETCLSGRLSKLDG